MGDRHRCGCCRRWIGVVNGRLKPHAEGHLPCSGSGKAVTTGVFGPVRTAMSMGETPCAVCGRHVETMTVHDTAHVLWPCGHAFPVRPVQTQPAPDVVVPEQQSASTGDRTVEAAFALDCPS